MVVKIVIWSTFFTATSLKLDNRSSGKLAHYFIDLTAVMDA